MASQMQLGLSRSVLALRTGLGATAARAVLRPAASCVVGTRSKTEWVGLTNDQDFFNKNKKLNRPMSPHLTIYRFPLPAIMSISHRGTGIGLTGAVSAAAIGLYFHPLAYYIDAVQAMNLHPAVFLAAKTTLALPFTYHTFNGIRHLIWDTAKGLELGSVYQSGYITIGISVVTAALIAML